MTRGLATSRRLRTTVLAITIAVLGPSGLAYAQIYRWTDESGATHYTQSIDNVPQRHRPRAVPLEYRNNPAQAPGPADEAPREPTGGTTIRFTPGQRILVDARINGGMAARLLLDTGADRTLISPRALVAAGVSITRPAATGQISGVTGTSEADGVQIRSEEVGEARTGPMLVISHDVNQAGIDGLLGRDFLDQFHVTIDSRSGLVTLAPR